MKTGMLVALMCLGMMGTLNAHACESAQADTSNGPAYTCVDGSGYAIYLTVNKINLLTYSDGTLNPAVMLSETGPDEFTGSNYKGAISLHLEEASLLQPKFAMRGSDGNRTGDNFICTRE